jgi:hypothetical protein
VKRIHTSSKNECGQCSKVNAIYTCFSKRVFYQTRSRDAIAADHSAADHSADNSGSRTAVGALSPGWYDPVFTFLFSLATVHPHEGLSAFDQFKDIPMKRSRRVVLTMMGTAAIGAVSTGFVRRAPCGPGTVAVAIPGPDRGSVETCRVRYGGFGGAPHRLHGHGHFHGGS